MSKDKEIVYQTHIAALNDQIERQSHHIEQLSGQIERLQLLEDPSDPHDPRRPASPGSTQPTSTVPGTYLVEPSPSRVAAFTRMVTEDASWREETGGRP